MNHTDGKPNTIALILKGYPRLSETFIAQEIRALEKRGMKILLVSLRHPTDKRTHPIHDEIQAPVLYLPEYLHEEPLRVLKALFGSLRAPGFGKALKSFWRDLRRDLNRNRVRRFGQALVLAHELPPEYQHLYAHFIHTPASVTRYTALLKDLPWSASAHAKDIWTLESWELKEKLQELEWIATCTEANYHYLQSLAAEPARVNLVYHGLDFNRFDTPPTEHSQRDGSDASQPVRLVSVGRAVPKKGYDILLEALASLPKDLHWQFTHIGGGSELETLKAQAERLGISEHIHWQGALAQVEVLEAYRQSDLFVLASRITEDGDRDGLPNVLMEAQSQRLSCLSTDISGIPELIRHEETGLLVPQSDAPALATALARLIREPELRQRLANGGYERVREVFAMDRGIDQLQHLFHHDHPHTDSASCCPSPSTPH
ncbi:glycosyltransferase family 4 protein [Pokkaliibacter sp. CJK22405]|uniref:glycosyltransferase family 4 protein n=1 Tax=Pokkaliibacter sp. CJK22405 TaxID=3384615 RepID=UPI0039846AEE